MDASDALYEKHGPYRSGLFRATLAKLNDNALFGFARDIDRHLQKEEGGNKIWDLWLKEYWEQRLNGIPVQISERESQCMIYWSLYVGDAFPDAVQLTLRMQPGRASVNTFSKKILEKKLASQFPDAVCTLLTHILRFDHFSYREPECLDVRKILMESEVDSGLLSALEDELYKRGWEGPE